MKLKKKPKRILITIIVIAAVVAIGFVGYNIFFGQPEVKEAKVLKTIDKYGYTLKDNKTKRYQDMFGELDKILSKDPVDEEAYVKKITEMIIYDFYSLEDKTAKTDVGGTDFIYSESLSNFLENAEDTYYKYVESDIYNQRKQKLPAVDKITIESVEQTEFAYGETSDDSAYEVQVSWTYTDSDFDNYQSEATLTFIHEGIKLALAELK